VELTNDLKINFYLGAHRTAGQHLYYTMSQHEEALQEAGVYIPSMLETGRALSIVVPSLNQGRDINAVRQDFFDTLLAGAPSQPKTVVVMSKGMLGPVHMPFSSEGIYSAAAKRCQILITLLQGFDVTFFLATRSPVNFAVSCYGEAIAAGREMSLQEFMGQIPVNLFKWSITIESMLSVLPADRLCAFAYEDYSKIAKELMSNLTGVDADQFTKKLRPINVGVSLEGVELIKDHIAGKPYPGPEAMRKLFDQYAESYPSMEPPRNHPIFTPELIEQLSYSYEDDWYYIERIEELRTIRAETTV